MTARKKAPDAVGQEPASSSKSARKKAPDAARRTLSSTPKSTSKSAPESAPKGAHARLPVRTAPEQPLFSVLAKYFGVSGAQTLVELGSFTLLSVLGVPSALANGAAIALSASTNFLLNRNVTFKSSGNVVRSAVLFVCLWAWNYYFSTTAIAHLPGILGVNEVVVKLATMMVQACWGFPLLRFVIFR